MTTTYMYYYLCSALIVLFSSSQAWASLESTVDSSKLEDDTTQHSVTSFNDLFIQLDQNQNGNVSPEEIKQV